MTLQVAGQVDAVDEAHVEVGLAVDLAVIVDGYDMRVAQPGGQLGLAQEPTLEVHVGSQPGRQALERHHPVLASVPGPEDLAHPAPPDQSLQLIGPELLFGHIATSYAC